VNYERIKRVAFAEGKLLEEYNELEKSDRLLYGFISRALDDLKENPECGIHIPKRLIPKVYVQKYGINNLWKYNLPGYWRLIYSITGSKAEVISIVLEWMSHKEYDRRSHYR
jgi:hypothetical protein